MRLTATSLSVARANALTVVAAPAAHQTSAFAINLGQTVTLSGLTIQTVRCWYFPSRLGESNRHAGRKHERGFVNRATFVPALASGLMI